MVSGNGLKTKLHPLGNYGTLGFATKYVVLADYSNVGIYSADGENWRTVTLPYSGYWVAMFRGDDKFVAVSSTHVVFSSSSGTSWEAVELPITGVVAGVYGNVWRAGFKQYIVVNNQGKVAYSHDCRTWTVEDLPLETGRSISVTAITFAQDDPEKGSETDSRFCILCRYGGYGLTAYDAIFYGYGGNWDLDLRAWMKSGGQAGDRVPAGTWGDVMYGHGEYVFSSLPATETSSGPQHYVAVGQNPYSYFWYSPAYPDGIPKTAEFPEPRVVYSTTQNVFVTIDRQVGKIYAAYNEPRNWGEHTPTGGPYIFTSVCHAHASDSFAVVGYSQSSSDSNRYLFLSQYGTSWERITLPAGYNWKMVSGA